MTRDEILNMPAGREMDLLIADTFSLKEGQVFVYIEPFSTNMEAAWKVVEKTAKEPFAWDISSINVGGKTIWSALYWGIEEVFCEAEADTAPLAICRAALLATSAKTLKG